jgi:hypothetical protein
MTSRKLGALGSSVACHVVAGTSLLWSMSIGARSAARTGSATAMTVFVVAPPQDATFAGLNPIDRGHDDPPIEDAHAAASGSIGAYTFDLEKIRARATLLFPFVTPGLALDYFGLTTARPVAEAFRDPAAVQPRRSPASAVKTPLVLSDAALQSLTDASWSRRQRWRAFQRVRTLADTYSPETGRLPDALHAYLDQNWLQPYADPAIRDPRVWTELGLAADHVDFIGFISRYASEHPAARATTELLLLLDKIAQASHDDLVALLDTRPSEELQATRDANRPAYDLLVGIRSHYLAELERLDLTSREALHAYYDTIRLTILAGILRTTPQEYRASDVRFLIGTIYWRQGRAHEALQAWRGMRIDPTDSYVSASSDILSAMRAVPPGADATRDASFTRRIRRILESEHGRWFEFSYERLRKFGYRMDTF